MFLRATFAVEVFLHILGIDRFKSLSGFYIPERAMTSSLNTTQFSGSISRVAKFSHSMNMTRSSDNHFGG